MRIRWTPILITAALVFWFFAAAAVARAQECPTNGWLLAGGPSVTQVTPLADGPLHAWINEGWRFNDGADSAKVVLQIVSDRAVLRSYVKNEQGAWIERGVFNLRPHQRVPCLLVTVEPVTVDAMGQPIFLFIGHAPGFADHDHTDVQSINVVNVPELKRS